MLGVKRYSNYPAANFKLALAGVIHGSIKEDAQKYDVSRSTLFRKNC